MKYWELSSVCREEKDILMSILSQDKWKTFHECETNMLKLLKTGDRSVLDSEAPDELCLEVFSKVKMKYLLSGGVLRCSKHNLKTRMGGSELSALETFKRFGGAKMEEAQESGSARIK